MAKIIHIAATATDVYALRDDGSMWAMRTDTEQWRKLPDIPGDITGQGTASRSGQSWTVIYQDMKINGEEPRATFDLRGQDTHTKQKSTITPFLESNQTVTQHGECTVIRGIKTGTVTIDPTLKELGQDISATYTIHGQDGERKASSGYGENPKVWNKPIVDDRTWLALPSWIRTEDCHIARDNDGGWCAFVGCPMRIEHLWLLPVTGASFVKIHKTFAPKFDGDWKDSLVKIPPQFVHRDGEHVYQHGWRRFDTFKEFCAWGLGAVIESINQDSTTLTTHGIFFNYKTFIENHWYYKDNEEIYHVSIWDKSKLYRKANQ